MDFEIKNYDIELKELERLHYEVNARAEIVALLINKQMQNSESFDKYWIEYLKVFKQYQEAKNKFVQIIVAPITVDEVNWEIDFNNKICHIK
jgi:hypothetical protein